ncbi:hypothetical protein K7I13_09070 [Brucepastera parasyntrophica]|uniref:hypothetical protein n=1 Tax=Brucepastera parasyntrophica TaxID=2880008 RepID=UPI00210A6901|nr:hypothetical protein [Brucepastera parasyntrophica]ULQ58706.1 hypothetical protein K7I13_09070 [Brucepastera parasyntrophica]
MYPINNLSINLLFGAFTPAGPVELACGLGVGYAVFTNSVGPLKTSFNVNIQYMFTSDTKPIAEGDFSLNLGVKLGF